MPTATFAPDDTLTLTNLKKVFWPEQGYTKHDLINYYRTISDVILPHLVDRPQVLHRHVDGFSGKEFFQRVSRQRPSWIQVAQVAVDGRRKTREFHLCQNWPTLLWLANFGCIELIPWNSRIGSLDTPDYLVFDLDPGDVPFQRVIETAVMVRRVLDQAGAESVCKTSGKRGLHVYVPLGKSYSHAHAKMFGDIITTLVHRRLPELTTVDPRNEKRQGRVYLDQTRNARGQAMAAPYAARPHPGATVSTPLKWSEVRKGLDPGRFTIKSVPARIEKVGDLWQPVLGPGIDMWECLHRLQRVRL